jgi:hypothetical protein
MVPIGEGGVMTEPTDNCGNCLTPGCAVSVAPYHVEADDTESVRAFYRCPGCGHSWSASYILGAEETERVLRQSGAA